MSFGSVPALLLVAPHWKVEEDRMQRLQLAKQSTDEEIVDIHAQC